MKSLDYDKYIKYCASDRELDIVSALITEGTQKKAAKKLDLNQRSVERRFKEIKKRAQIHGYSPENDLIHEVPQTQVLQGASSLYKYNNEEGLVLQWIRSKQSSEEQLEAMQETIEVLKEDIPKYKPKKLLKSVAKKSIDDLVNLHVCTDYHMGVLCWGEETGEDWDLDKSERLILDWFHYAIQNAPNANTGIFAQLGDLLHWDGMLPVTPTNRHVLDADTRFPKLVRTVIRVVTRIIDMMLDKYPNVHIIMSDANHDPASAVWLRETLALFYSKADRVTVDTTPGTFNAFKYGDTSLFFHHGHKKKIKDLDKVFAGNFRDIYGSTKFSYGHTGHLHHIDIKEDCLMVIEQHRSMAPSDSYSYNGGYISGRSASVITYSATLGQIGRMEVTPEMIQLAYESK